MPRPCWMTKGSTTVRIVLRLISTILLLATLQLRAQTPQGTSFTYQGELRQNGLPVTNTSPGVDMVFVLWDAPTGGSQIGPMLSFTAGSANPVAVVNGIFTVALDFGGSAFVSLVSDQRYLAVTVNGNALVPRTKIENAPYALQSTTAELAYSVSNASIGSAQIIPSQVQQRVTGTCGPGTSINAIDNAGAVTCQAAGSGTVTSISAGTGLSGGTITSSGTIAIASGGVGNPQLADGSVTQPKIATGAVGTNQIASHAVTQAQVDSTVQQALASSCSSGLYLVGFSSSGTPNCVAATLAGSTWNLAGNAIGTSGNFLGTTDSQPLVFKVGTQVGMILPSGNSTYTDAPSVVFGFSGNTVTTVPASTNPAGATIGGGGSTGSNCGRLNNLPCANSATGDFATVGGGLGNMASNIDATVGGGFSNTASSDSATVGGGNANTASGSQTTVGGGVNNAASGDNATVGGGAINTASSNYATVGGGNYNGASNIYATVGGGYSNAASGYGATVAGGRGDQAGGDFSFAAGHSAKVRDSGSGTFGANNAGTCIAGTNCGDYGSFVWADANTAFVSSGPNQFLIRAAGGVAINTNLPQAGFDLTVQGHATKGDGSTAWSTFSDARLKKNIQPLGHALDRVLALRGRTFEYIDPQLAFSQPGTQIGFVAQEVETVFPNWVDEDPRGYKFVTVRGFEALSVEALRELRAEKDAENEELRTENADLRARLERIEAQLGIAERRP